MGTSKTHSEWAQFVFVREAPGRQFERQHAEAVHCGRKRSNGEKARRR